MKISDDMERFLEEHKKELVTEEDAYKVWRYAVEHKPGYRLSTNDTDELITLFISAGVHFEKYLTADTELAIWFNALTFEKPVELHFDSLTSIDDLFCVNLYNVKSIYLPNCKDITHMEKGQVICNCPDLEYVFIPLCEYLPESAFQGCDNLEVVE